MEIRYSSNKLRRTFNKHVLLVRKYGPEQAKVIRKRIGQLKSVNTLAEIGHGPPARCHQLIGDHAGQLSLDLKHPYRLIIEPANNPIPLKDDGGLDWTQVTIVRIIGVEDTHG